MKFVQSPTNTVMFTLPPNYKSLQPQEETDKQYWNEIVVTFLKQQ